MSREGWIIATLSCLLLIVGYAMCTGLSPDPKPTAARQRPRDDGPPSPTRDDETADEDQPTETSAPLEGEDEEPARTVTGEVTDANGRPVEGARVALKGHEDVAAITDSDGAFSLANLSPAPIVLLVRAFGYAESNVDVPAQSKALEVVMEPADGVTGTVLDPDGKPVAGASVKCAGASDKSATTDSRGRFTLTKKSVGCDGVASHTEFAESARVELKLGPDNFLALRTQGSIKGVVLDPGGAPFPGFVLSLHRFTPADGKAKMRPYRQTFSHPQGRFVINKLPAGTYVFTVGLRGRPGIPTDPIRLKSGQQLTGVKITVR